MTSVPGVVTLNVVVDGLVTRLVVEETIRSCYMYVVYFSFYH